MGRRLLSVLTVAVLSLGSVVFPVMLAPANAISGSEFDPGMIISDQLFYDANAMSASQIQSFLDRQIGTCQTSRCLNVAVLPVASRAASYSTKTGELVCSAIAGGNLRVSELIYRTQKACSISAKVILVTLQKEQGLVTSRAPSDWALRSAMGMGCPDTASCDDAFAGLGAQIMSGAYQLRVYKAGRFARQPGVQYVQYNPTASCGGTTLNVRNYATAALYNYTPYQPNAAALANLGGAGDSCSSYGNRNFWNYYRNWFGSIDGLQYMSSTADGDYLITRDADNALWAYPVLPGGGWGLKTSLGVGWGGVKDVIGVGDLDGNGFRDIVARDTSGKSWFYPGGSALSYLTRKQLNVDWSTAKFVLYGGYVDAWSDADMLTVDAAGDLWLWPGDGTGSFKSAQKIGSGFGAYTVVAGVGDFTGDGCGDLLAIAPSGALMLHPGNCVGGFQKPTQIGTGFAGFTGLYAAGDFNGDGRADLWAKDAAGAMHLFRGTGGGAIANTSVVDQGWNSMQNIVGAGMVPARPPVITTVSSTSDMSAGYLIARDTKNTLWAYPANATGAWLDRLSLGAGWAGVTDVIGVGDLDGNGYRDIVARDSAGKSWFYPGGSSLDYPQRRQISADWSTATHLLYGGYFDADSFADMLTADPAGDLWLWPGDGTGGFGAKVKMASGFGGVIAIAGVGDFDGDRCGDIVTIAAGGQLMLYRGNCVGGLKTALQIGTGFSGYTGIYSTGDFTGDKIPDLWIKNVDGTIRLFRGTGTGAVASTGVINYGWGSFQNLTGAGMQPGTTLPTKFAGTPAPAPTPPPTPLVGQTGVGDINGDAKRDFLGVSADGQLHAYYGSGTGQIASDKVIDPTWGILVKQQFPMGDFNGDGWPDVGLITSAGDFLIAKGKAGGFEKPVWLASNWGNFDVVVGALDWDGDGHVDVMARSRTGDLWLYRGDGAGGWASQSGILLATGWSGYRPIPVGNFDGSGGDDILALQSNGDLWLYRGNGSGGWASPSGTLVGNGWNSFVSVFSPGEFDGVAGTDVLARTADGRLYLYAGTGKGGFRSPVQIDAGWQSFTAIF